VCCVVCRCADGWCLRRQMSSVDFCTYVSRWAPACRLAGPSRWHLVLLELTRNLHAIQLFARHYSQTIPPSPLPLFPFSSPFVRCPLRVVQRAFPFVRRQAASVHLAACVHRRCTRTTLRIYRHVPLRHAHRHSGTRTLDAPRTARQHDEHAHTPSHARSEHPCAASAKTT